MESAAVVAFRNDQDIDDEDLVDIVHDAVLREGMRDISKYAVERLLETPADDNIDDDGDA